MKPHRQSVTASSQFLLKRQCLTSVPSINMNFFRLFTAAPTVTSASCCCPIFHSRSGSKTSNCTAHLSTDQCVKARGSHNSGLFRRTPTYLNQNSLGSETRSKLDVFSIQLNQLRSQLTTLSQRVNDLETSNTNQSLMNYFASLEPTPLDLHTIVEKCQDPTYRPCIFTHRELPILLAHLIKVVEKFPNGLNSMPRVQAVRQILEATFKSVVHSSVPVCRASEKAFLEIVEKRDEAHKPIVEHLAEGVKELRNLLIKHRAALGSRAVMERRGLDQNAVLQANLDYFYFLYLRTTFLMRQLIQLMNATNSHGVVGIVDTQCDLKDLCRSAISKASEICTMEVGDCPDIQLICDKTEDIVLPLLADHLQYIVIEMLKNSLHATVKTHLKRDETGFVTCDDMPPVVLKIIGGDSEYATISVEDQGGGIKRSDMTSIMCYTYSTAGDLAKAMAQSRPKRECEEPEHLLMGMAEKKDPSEGHSPTPLAGYGFGLPMSRVYARIFGGDIITASVEGYGTRVLIYIHKSIHKPDANSSGGIGDKTLQDLIEERQAALQAVNK